MTFYMLVEQLVSQIFGQANTLLNDDMLVEQLVSKHIIWLTN